MLAKSLLIITWKLDIRNTRARLFFAQRIFLFWFCADSPNSSCTQERVFGQADCELGSENTQDHPLFFFSFKKKQQHVIFEYFVSITNCYLILSFLAVYLCNLLDFWIISFLCQLFSTRVRLFISRCCICVQPNFSFSSIEALDFSFCLLFYFFVFARFLFGQLGFFSLLCKVCNVCIQLLVASSH